MDRVADDALSGRQHTGRYRAEPAGRAPAIECRPGAETHLAAGPPRAWGSRLPLAGRAGITADARAPGSNFTNQAAGVDFRSLDDKELALRRSSCARRRRSPHRCSTAPPRRKMRELPRLAGLSETGQSTLYDGRTGDLRTTGDGPYVHAQAEPPGGRQDACPLNRSLQPGHAAAAGRQGAIGGQRFGEMEVPKPTARPIPFAGNADGEIDDVNGRTKVLQEHRGR